jgi:hypothetical protein
MAFNKTKISVPSLYLYQYAPNTAKNVSALTYNEGIFLKDESLKYTYPKSVVRIYKNPNFPKKMYLLSKDTSILQSIGKKFQSGADALSVQELYEYSYLNPYFSNDVEELRKYSTFQQPTNLIDLNFDDSSLIGKSINFYNLSLSEFTTLSKSLSGPVNDTTNGLLRNVEPDLVYDDVTYSYLLKSKSMVTDYQNDSDTYLEKQVTIFNFGLFQYWNDSGFITAIKPLSEDQIRLFKDTKITKTKTINFGSFVNTTYKDIWVQKIDNETQYAGPNSANNSYVISVFDEVQNEWNTLRYNPTYNTLPDNNFIDYLVDKKIFAVKQDYVMGEYLNSRQFFEIPGNSPDSLKPYYLVGTTTEVTGAFTQNTYDLLNNDYKLNLTASNYEGIYDYGSTNRSNQIQDLNKYDLSTLYLINDDYSYSSLGFIPDDPNQTIYEIEVEEEIDIENGSFVVVEIE